ncbi:MAG: hypothetical protein JJE28_04085 [Actinomycetales bacterium]|nr:hypothetical protein [Actinomycetales bacterium]
MTTATTTARKTTNLGRAWLAGVLLTLGVLLAPTAVVGHWATVEITNTKQFVETLGPLAKNPAVQALIVDEVTGLINDQVDISTATDSLLTGLGDALNLPKAAKDALGLVSGPVASGVTALIHNVVANVVASDAFQEAWTKTLTLTQTQIVALLTGDPNSMLTLANDGTISLPLKPLIQDVKAALVEQGVSFASAIPEVDTSVVIAKIPELALARVIYQIGVGVGLWLPWVVLGLLAAGVFVANRRPRALLGTSIAMGLVMGILAIGFGTGGIIIAASIEPAFADAAGVVYAALVTYVLQIVAALVTLAVVLGFTGWAFGGSLAAGKLRANINKNIDAIRGALGQTNLPFNTASPVMHHYRVLARVVILVLMALGVIGSNPLNVGAVVGFTILGVIVMGAYEILQRSVVEPPAAPVVPVATKSAAKKPVAKKPAPKKPTA